MSRKEIYHSNFIAWLLDDKANHNLNDYALRKLLETCCLIDSQFNNRSLLADELIAQNIISGSYKLENIVVMRERPTRKTKKRVDIYIQVDIHYDQNVKQKLHIIIENKIYSAEGGNQTQGYYDWARNEFGGDKLICIYLSPLPNKTFKNSLMQGKSLCSSENFLPMNYQYFLDGVIEPCLIKNPSDEARILIENYICCLSQPLMEDIDSDHSKKGNDKSYMVMAVGNKENNIIYQLWETHKVLLETIITEALATKQNSEAKELVKAFYRGHHKIFSLSYHKMII